MRPIDADELQERVEIICGSETELCKTVSNYLRNSPTIELEPDLPPEPIQCAAMLIESSFEYETSVIQQALGAGEKAKAKYYDIDKLRQIAEHLLIYCNHADEEREDT